MDTLTQFDFKELLQIFILRGQKAKVLNLLLEFSKKDNQSHEIKRLCVIAYENHTDPVVFGLALKTIQKGIRKC